MHGAKNFPFIFLTLLAGCTEQPPGRPRVTAPDPIVETQTPVADQPGIGPDLYKVIKTVDGDTIDVLAADKKTIRLRFNGIDTPERGQPFSNNATKFVSDTVRGKMV
jgi:endonuclease YncB( thermonuclease family)